MGHSREAHVPAVRIQAGRGCPPLQQLLLACNAAVSCRCCNALQSCPAEADVPSANAVWCALSMPCRQRIEIRLAMLYMDSKDYPAALHLIGAPGECSASSCVQRAL